MLRHPRDAFAQFAAVPGVRLPSNLDPAAPVALGTFAATPSIVSAASNPGATDLRESVGTPKRPFAPASSPVLFEEAPQ